VTPKNPDAERYKSSWKRGYRHVTFTEDQLKELLAACGGSKPADAARYLWHLHEQKKATQSARP
jgi:hypothetical protein